MALVIQLYPKEEANQAGKKPSPGQTGNPTLQVDCRINHLIGGKDRTNRKGGIRVQIVQPLAVDLRIFSAGGSWQHIHQDAQGIHAIGIFFE